MNKPLITLGIAVLLITVGLSGCNETNNSLADEESRFIGTWNSGSGMSRTTFIFFSDGTGSLAGGSTTWSLKDGKLVVYWLGGTTTLTYDYSFSENDTKLTLTDVSSGDSKVFTKQ